MDNSYNKRDLLSIYDLTEKDINTIFESADNYIDTLGTNSVLLNNHIVLNLFFENSTRTLTSFEIAAKRLGAQVVNIQIASSSVKKGESLLDTIMTLKSMDPNFCIIRHQSSGVVALLSKKISCPVINAGDGSHEHPTQALLDAFTIKQKFGGFKNLVIAICGDILHSRVARSNIILLTRLGAKVRVIAPSTLLPSNIYIPNVTTYYHMKEGIKDCDVIMMLRIQQERMQGSFIPSTGEFYKFYGLNKEKLAYAKENVMIMHPGPINRGVEIEGSLADDRKYSVILDQVKNGIAIRQAVLTLLDSTLSNAK